LWICKHVYSLQYLHIKFKMPWSHGLLVITIKLKISTQLHIFQRAVTIRHFRTLYYMALVLLPPCSCVRHVVTNCTKLKSTWFWCLPVP
jgi:hypothetical protein